MAQSMSLESGLSIGTNVAVIIGLVLVVMELNQNAELTRIDMINEANATENSLFQTLMEEVPKDAIAKTVECPERLDLSDYVVLDAYLFTGMNLVYRNYELAKEDFFTEQDWKTEVDTYAHWYLSGEFGSAYWENVGRNYFANEFAEYVDAVLATEGDDVGSAWEKVASELPRDNDDAVPLSAACR